MGIGTVSFVFPCFSFVPLGGCSPLRLFPDNPHLGHPRVVFTVGRDMGDWEASKRCHGWWRGCVFRLAVIVAIGLGDDLLVSFLIYSFWLRRLDCAALASGRWFVPHHSPPWWAGLMPGSLPLRFTEFHVIGIGFADPYAGLPGRCILGPGGYFLNVQSC